MNRTALKRILEGGAVPAATAGPHGTPLRTDRQPTCADQELTAAYRRYWTIHESAPLEVFHAAYGEIAKLEAQADPQVAWHTLRNAATSYHAETGLCPFCRERGSLHLPAEQISGELLDHDHENAERH